MIAVVAENDGVAKAQLIGRVELLCKRSVQPLRLKKLAEAPDQHLVFVDLAALHALPVALVDG